MQGRFRLQGPEDPAARPALPPLEMPSPESMGRIAEPRAINVDWTDVRRRLDDLKATSFHLQKVAGGYRFSCIVPTSAGERRTVAGEARNEAAAINQALVQANRAD